MQPRGAMMPEPATPVRTDQRVILTDVPWDAYDALVASVIDRRPALRMTYLEGTLEIMTTSSRHEYLKDFIARLLGTFALEREINLIGFGAATYRKKRRKGGLEPDQCYCLGDEKPLPDLAIEVVLTSGGIDKLAVYQRLGVAEVWFLVGSRFRVYRLGGAGYEEQPGSTILPELDLAQMAKLVTTTPPSEQLGALRRFRDSLRAAAPGPARRARRTPGGRAGP